MSKILIRLRNYAPLWATLTSKRKKQLYILAVLSIFSAFSEAVNIQALLPFLRVLSNPEQNTAYLIKVLPQLQSVSNSLILATLGLIFILSVVLSSFLRIVTIYTQLRLTASITSDLAEYVFTKILYMPYSWHISQNTSFILGVITKDIDQVSNSVNYLISLVVNATIVIFLGLTLLSLSPMLVLIISSAIVGFYILVFRYTKHSLQGDGQRLSIKYQSALQIAQEALGGIRDVIINKSQPFFVNLFNERNYSYRSAVSAINIKAQVPRYLIEGFSMIIIVSLSIYLALIGNGIEDQLPLLGAVSLGAYRLLQPFQLCFNSISLLQANMASVGILTPFLNMNTELPSKPLIIGKTGTDTLSPFSCQSEIIPLIEFKDTCFRYDSNGKEILSNISLKIFSGDRVGIVGVTGSGKSTFGDLLLGLLKPSSGSIFVLGRDMHSTPDLLSEWHNRIAHVPQNIFLSDASFSDNIAFGVPISDIDSNRVINSAIQAQVDGIIRSSVQGYQTLVGERGQRLSGGQRQRIGIARALYAASDILLFDEATSSLDTSTESFVMDSIYSLSRSITIITIAHRLSTIKHCDKIVLLSSGRLVAVDTFDNLSKFNSVFQSLLGFSQ